MSCISYPKLALKRGISCPEIYGDPTLLLPLCFILDSKFVIASALSGVIVAESFGIPARLLIVDNAENTENLFKYVDYYEGTGRPNFRYATSLEEALEMGGEPPVCCDLQKLYEAFPFELFESHRREASARRNI